LTKEQHSGCAGARGKRLSLPHRVGFRGLNIKVINREKKNVENVLVLYEGG